VVLEQRQRRPGQSSASNGRYSDEEQTFRGRPRHGNLSRVKSRQPISFLPIRLI
jgi:hypothetical protein